MIVGVVVVLLLLSPEVSPCGYKKIRIMCHAHRRTYAILVEMVWISCELSYVTLRDR